MMTGSLESALYKELDSTNLIRCNLSSRHHNRICVEQKKIKKFLYPEGEILIQLDEHSGQLFVQPMVTAPSCTTLSIIISDGTVQDLELTFSEKSSETLILQPNPEAESVYEEVTFECTPDDIRLETIQSALRCINTGMVSAEFDVVVNERSFFDKKNRLLMTSKSSLVSASYTIYMVIVENRSRFTKNISEQDINFICGEWVWLEKSCLLRGERSLALIGVKNDEL
jgi:hypothetical protein